VVHQVENQAAPAKLQSRSQARRTCSSCVRI
jgi:hypothetical protein